MAGEGNRGVSPTGLYTGQVWVDHGLAPASFATREGQAFARALAPLGLASRMFGGPSLEGMLVARHRLIDLRLRSAIADGAVDVVLELACGLSGRGLRMVAAHLELVGYVESDLAAVVTRKRALLTEANAPARLEVRTVDALAPAESPSSLEYTLAHLPGQRGIAVLAEGLLSYLGPADLRALWRRIAIGLAARGGVYLADLHLGDHNRGLTSQAFATLLSAFVRGRVHIHFPDVETAAQAAQADGFVNVRVRRPEDPTEGLLDVEAAGAARVRVLEAWVRDPTAGA